MHMSFTIIILEKKWIKHQVVKIQGKLAGLHIATISKEFPLQLHINETKPKETRAAVLLIMLQHILME